MLVVNCSAAVTAVRNLMLSPLHGHFDRPERTHGEMIDADMRLTLSALVTVLAVCELYWAGLTAWKLR